MTGKENSMATKPKVGVLVMALLEDDVEVIEIRLNAVCSKADLLSMPVVLEVVVRR